MSLCELASSFPQLTGTRSGDTEEAIILHSGKGFQPPGAQAAVTFWEITVITFSQVLQLEEKPEGGAMQTLCRAAGMTAPVALSAHFPAQAQALRISTALPQ